MKMRKIGGEGEGEDEGPEENDVDRICLDPNY